MLALIRSFVEDAYNIVSFGLIVVSFLGFNSLDNGYGLRLPSCTMLGKILTIAFYIHLSLIDVHTTAVSAG